MAGGKAMTSLNRSQGDMQSELAKLHAKYRKLSDRIAHLDERAEAALAAPRWYPYATGLGLFGLGVAVSAVLF